MEHHERQTALSLGMVRQPLQLRAGSVDRGVTCLSYDGWSFPGLYPSLGQ